MDIQSFFKNSKSVWTSENFQTIFLNNYDNTQANLLNSSVGFLNLQDIEEKDIRGLVFNNPNTFLNQLAGLIQKQINGEDGELLNDSSANYFFLKGKDGNNYSILVRWESAQKLWRCGAYLQESLAMPNIRIFYPL
jgi:hypothetical protein